MEVYVEIKRKEMMKSLKQGFISMVARELIEELLEMLISSDKGLHELKDRRKK